MVGVIDYRMGNLRSVVNAFSSLAVPVFVAQGPEDLSRATHVVLPGVGAFADAMSNLRQAGWIDRLEEDVRRMGKPFLGICLGMQLLASSGTEYGNHAGLNWVGGSADRLRGVGQLRLPHIGWNDVHIQRQEGLYKGLGSIQTFYFVHSYALYLSDSTPVSGTCEYGERFVASIEAGNIVATQFHPEKSHKAGLVVLRNFVDMGPSNA